MQKYIILAILLLFIASCEQKKIRLQPELSQAEQLMEIHPDSARTLLLRLKDKVNAAGKSDRMKYTLLFTEADDKCYINHTSDSAMLPVVAYYERHGSPCQKMKAYYLLGRVYNDMQFTGEALSAFRKALDTECEDDTTTYIVRARAGNHIGHIYMYMYKGMYQEALPFFYQSYYYARLAKNRSIEVFALRDIGRNYCARREMKKGLAYYEYAASVARKTGQDFLYKMVMGEAAIYYQKNKDYDKTKRALIQGNGLSDSGNLYPHYICWGNYYQEVSRIDSAIYFYNKSLESQDPYVLRAAILPLAHIYADKGDYKRAFSFLDKQTSIADTLTKKESINNENLIKELSNKLHIEQENRLLKEKAFSLRLIGIVTSAVFIIAILLVFHRLRNKRLQYYNQEERLKRVLSDMEQNSRQKLLENSERIDILKNQLSSSQVQNDNLQKRLILLEKDSLLGENRRIEAVAEKQIILLQRLKTSSVYLKFYQLAKLRQKASDDDFYQLTLLVDEAYSGFTNRLIELYPSINEKEIRVCLLIKIGLSPTQISDIVCSSNSGISMIRRRLNQKIFQIKGKPEEFDKKIIEL